MHQSSFLCRLSCLISFLLWSTLWAFDLDPKQIDDAAQLHLDGTIKEYVESIENTGKNAPAWKNSEERSIAPAPVRLRAIEIAVEAAKKSKRAEDWILAGTAAQYALLHSRADTYWQYALETGAAPERAHFFLALSAAWRDDWAGTSVHIPSLSASAANRFAKAFSIGQRGSAVALEYLNAAEKLLTSHPTLSTSILPGLGTALTDLGQRDQSLAASWQGRLGRLMLRSPANARQGLHWTLPSITNPEEKITCLVTVLESLRADRPIGDGAEKSKTSEAALGDRLTCEPGPLRQLFDLLDEQKITALLPRLDPKEQERLKALQTFRHSPSATTARHMLRQTSSQDAPWTLIAQVFQAKGATATLEELSPDLVGSVKTWNLDSFSDLGRALGIFAVEQFKSRGATGATLFIHQLKSIPALEFETKYLCPNCHSFHTDRKTFRLAALLAVMAQPQVSTLAVKALLAEFPHRSARGVEVGNPFQVRSSDENNDASLAFTSALMPVMPLGCNPSAGQRELFQAVLLAGDCALEAKNLDDSKGKIYRDLGMVLGQIASLQASQRAKLLESTPFSDKPWSNLCKAVLSPPGTQRAALETALAKNFDILLADADIVKSFLSECAKLWLRLDGRSPKFDPPTAGGDPQNLGAQILLGLLPTMGREGSYWGLGMDLDGLSQRLSAPERGKSAHDFRYELEHFLQIPEESDKSRGEVLSRLALAPSLADMETWTLFPLIDRWIRSDPLFWDQAPSNSGPLILRGICQGLRQMDETSFASWTKVPHPSPVTAFAWAIEWKQRFPNTALPAHLLPSISQYFAVVDPKNPLSIVTAELLEQSQDAQSLGLDGIAANTVLELAKTALEQCKTAPPSHLLPALQVLLQAHQSAGFSEYAKPVLENWSNLEAKITSDSSEGKTEKSRVTLLQGELLHRLGKTEDALALLRGQMTSTPSIGLVAFCARLGLTDLLDEVLSSGIAIDTDPLSERWSCARPGQIASLGPKLKTPDAQHLLWASLHLLPQRLGIPKDGSQRRWSAPDRARVEQALRSWHPNFSQPTSATTVITLLSQISPAFGLLPGETGTKPCSLLAQQILKPDRSNDDHNWQRKQNKRQFLQAALERGDALALEVFLDTEDILSTEERYSYPSSSLQHSASLAALLPVIKATHQKAGSPELSGGFAGLVAATTNPEPAQRLNHNSWRYLVSLLPPREVATATRFLQQAAKHSPIPSRISADLLEQRSLVIPTESWLSSITKDEAYLESMQSIAASLQRDRDRTLAIKALDLALAYVGNRNPDLRIGLEQRKKWMLGEGIGLR